MKFIKQIIARGMNCQLSKFDEFYGRNAGQECYIFGNGPSLKWMDLNQFTDRPSIAVNFLFFHKEACVLNIPYCAIIEPYFFWPIMFYGSFWKPKFYVQHIQQAVRKSIVQNPSTLFFLNVSNYPVIRFHNVFYVCRWYKPPFETRNPFKDRLDYPYGSFEFQIALAIYLGFKKAYLVGSDKTHIPSRGRHFYDKGEGTKENIKDFFREYIDYAKQYIELVTVTLDGVSDTMDYITYEGLTGKKPAYRENYEIVDRDKLERLASWPGCSIF